MTKADEADELAKRINDITEYMDELKKERAALMNQLLEYVTINSAAHLVGMHNTTYGRIVRGLYKW